MVLYHLSILKEIVLLGPEKTLLMLCSGLRSLQHAKVMRRQDLGLIHKTGELKAGAQTQNPWFTRQVHVA